MTGALLSIEELAEAAPEFVPQPESIWTDDGKLIPLAVARNILIGRHVINIGREFFEYECGVYRRRPDHYFEQMVVDALGAKSKRNPLLDVMKLLQVLTAVDPDKVYHNGRIINLENGLLDLDAGLKPHTHRFISTTQIPICYAPDATCPAWRKALDEWFPGAADMVRLLQQWFGYCLVPDTRQHKAMVLVGEGANGKSVLCEILKSLIGHANVSAVSLNALSRSFALAELYGRLVNLTIEAEIRDGIEEGTFKQIVAGDLIQAERKFKDPFTFKPFARFTIATNNLFHVDDRSEGFYRRLLIVRFDRAFAEDQQDRGLTDTLMGELPGILNWALEGLADLETTGRFVIPRRVLDEVAEMKRHNNPVAAWAEECAQLGNPDYWESAAELYRSYAVWARDAGHRPLARNKFGVEVKRLPGVEARASSDRYTRTRGFSGVRLCAM